MESCEKGVFRDVGKTRPPGVNSMSKRCFLYGYGFFFKFNNFQKIAHARDSGLSDVRRQDAFERAESSKKLEASTQTTQVF